MVSRTLSLVIYNALLPLALLFMAPAALVKMRRRGGHWSDFGQRLGFWSAERRQAIAALPKDRLIWMHAVSVGEVGVARKLIWELLRQSPDQGVVLTSTTPTGHRLALELEQARPGRVVALYSPLDLPFVARRVLEQLRPRQIVLVEAEVWPNMVSRASTLGMPVSLVNARLSARSEQGYRRFHGLISPIFAMLDHVLVQEPEDVQRWASLGVSVNRITMAGSIKYDPQGAEPNPAQVAKLSQLLRQTRLLDRPLLLAASTHPGEERAMAQIYQRLQIKHPELGFLVVPRHYERGADVMTELQALGLQPLLRSGLTELSAEHTNVMVIDSTGELRAWIELGTIVVMGKSFLAEGGQNPAEAVMAGKLVVYGPHMENFLPLVSLLSGAHGALQLTNLDELERTLDAMLGDASARNAIANAGREALQRHHGATAKTAGLLREWQS
jgi:3-deoxy-D-manno-octulosonic-acid transferase